ncbi:MAG TPA: tetratricopeptide repeat protein [Dongiaceae bacterium]|nr:tetratricopeptide repeat protein [Dongiaceae bacterium]
MRRIAVILLILWSGVAHGAETPDDLAARGKFDEAASAYRKAIDASPEAAEKGLLHKKLGDLYAEKGDYRQAATEFVRALRLNRSFTEDERLRMAVRISWGGEYDEALKEFNAILTENFANMEARVGRARVLAWSGKYAEALAEIEGTLEREPGNREALLIKANCLRWQGHASDAIVILSRLLQEAEDFDTRLGLAYALLAKGDRSGARQSSALLVPKDRYQEKEAAALREELERQNASAIDMRYSYYSDTDDNTLHRYALSGTTLLGDTGLGAAYHHTDATDLFRHNSVDDLSVRLSMKVIEPVRLGAGAGFVRTHAAEDTTFFTGNVQSIFDVPNGKAGVSFSREIFTDTAQIIAHGIRISNTTAFFSQKAADRLSLFGSYSYRNYSDDNNTHDLQLSPVYRVHEGNPSISAGYRFRYLDFARQSGSGYFDPNDFMTNGLFINAHYERGGFHLDLEPFGGFQKFRRFGTGSSDLFGSIKGSAGYKIGRHLLCEVSGEFGNYALQSATGFTYHLVGARLEMLF